MTDYQKLKEIIDEIDVLIKKGVTSSNAEFQAWKTKAERFLVKKYGKDGVEYNKFIKTTFSLMIYVAGTPRSEFVEACRRGLNTSKAVFLTYLEELEEEYAGAHGVKTLPTTNSFSKIFVVHGHDGELKHAVARLVEKQGLSAIILSEQANRGKTIIEKFEENIDVGGVICLFTADDLGHAKSDKDEQPRARQNVVFEAGYFMGKLGRNHVVIIAEKGIELPSDMQGIVYTDKANWEVDALKELNAMGYKVDLNKLL